MGGPRHVGRVVDPLAREDGGLEPELSFDGAAPGGDDAGLPRRVTDSAAPPEEPGSDAEDDPSDFAVSTGHPVRDRLLAKAARARRGGAQSSATPASDDGIGSLPESHIEPEDELDLIARPPAAPRRAEGRALSPNMVALFGAVFGLATVASLFAVLIHVDPRDASAALAAPAKADKTEDEQQPPADGGAEAKPEEEKRQRIPGPWRVADSTDEGQKVIAGQIRREPFLRAIQDAGLEKQEAYRAYIALKDLVNLDKCGYSDRFAALVDRASSRLLAFEYIVSKEEVYQAREGDDGLLKGKRLDLKVERHRVQGAFRYDRETLAASARGAGFEEAIVDVIDEALEGHTSVDQFQRGDRVRLVAQEVTVLGEFSRYAGIEALEYVPADDDAKSLRIYYYRGAGAHGYYDARGRSPYEGGWRKPIKDAPITSHFNMKRMHPLLKKIMPHTGTDFGAPMGTPVGASAPGEIVFRGYAGPSGNLVKIAHSGGYETGYAHLSKFEPGLDVGDHVRRMQVIGYVGSTGRSTGPHLHFTAKKNGKFIDAESLKLDALRVLPKDERPRFAEARKKYDKLLEAIPLPKEISREPASPVEEAPSGGRAEDDPGDPEEAEESARAAEPAREEPEADSPKAAPAPKPVARAKAAPASTTSIYLTDRELMEAQSTVDDGEVER